jgi:hypothetical protein
MCVCVYECMCVSQSECVQESDVSREKRKIKLDSEKDMGGKKREQIKSTSGRGCIPPSQAVHLGQIRSSHPCQPLEMTAGA